MFSLPQESEPTLGDNTFKFVPNHGASSKSFTSNTVHSGGALTPDIKLGNPLLFLTNQKLTSVKKIGKYIVSERPGKNFTGPLFVCQALDSETGSNFVCKIIPIANYRKLLEPYWVAGSHENINNIHEILLSNRLAYVFFKKTYEDLHSFIRRKRKLKDDEVCWLFTQIVSAVKHCHDNGVVLRDLKLRKFVFEDSSCSRLLLDNLEDSCILMDQDSDLLLDRHGCPAYVSPEILFSVGGYSGKLADVWSLGVIFYTLLAGQYPFHDTDVGALFKKIRQGVYPIPDGATRKGKCLLRNLLRVDSTERMNIDEIFAHPWFKNRNLQRLRYGSSKFKNLNGDNTASLDNQNSLNNFNSNNYANINGSFNNSNTAYPTTFNGNPMNNHINNINNGNNFSNRSPVTNEEVSGNVSTAIPNFTPYVDNFTYVKTYYSPQNNDNPSKLDQMVPLFYADK